MDGQYDFEIKHLFGSPLAGCDSFGGVCNESEPQVCSLKSGAHMDEDAYLLPFSTNREFYEKRRHSFPSDIQPIGDRYGACM